MPRKYSIILVVLCILGALSCSEDFFTSNKTIDIPDVESQLVVLADLTIGDSCAQLIVSETQNILDIEPFKIIRDAEVNISGSGETFNFTIADHDSTYSLCDRSSSLAGDYTLSISSGDRVIEANSTVPNRVDLSNVVFELFKDTVSILDVNDLISFTIDDPPGDNYYSLKASFFEDFGVGILFEASYTILNPEEVASSFELFTDEEFRDSSRDFLLIMQRCCYLNESKIKKVRLTLSNLSEEAYLYRKSIIDYNKANSNPFIDPTNTYSNVNGGYGIFSFTNVSFYDIDVE